MKHLRITDMCSVYRLCIYIVHNSKYNIHCYGVGPMFSVLFEFQLNHFFSKSLDGPEKGRLFVSRVKRVYLLLVYLVTALVPSETACLASSPGRRSLTAV